MHRRRWCKEKIQEKEIVVDITVQKKYYLSDRYKVNV